MSTKIKILIFSIVLIFVSTCAFLVYHYWPAIKGTFTKSSYITEEQGQELYNKGLADGNKNESELKEQIKYYVELVDQVPALQSSIQDKTSTINQLTTELTSARDSLTLLQSQLDTLTESNSALEEQYNLASENVARLTNQLNQALAERNELQANIINYQTRINEFNVTIAGYENFINGLIAENQVVAKFYYDNSLYSIQVVQRGSHITITDPLNTTYKQFIGWYLDDEQVDLSTYTINSNTTFIAGINTFYDVNFVVDNESINSQVIIDGSYATAPTSPTKPGYDFDGWVVDNVCFDVSSYKITNNTTFVAKFTKVHNVQFKNGNDVLNTTTCRNNEYILDYTPTLSEYLQFNYWTVNGVKVNVANYPITSDTIFIANTTNKYDVQFMYEDTLYNSQIILSGSKALPVTPEDTDYLRFKGWSLDGTNLVDVANYPITENTTFIAVFDRYYLVSFLVDSSTYTTSLVKENNSVTAPTSPNKAGYEFDYWTLDNSTFDFANSSITSDISLTAVFTKLNSVMFKYEDEVLNTQSVRTNNYANDYNVPSTDYKIFNGWKLNNVIVNVSTTPITSDTIFVADIIYKQRVSFMVDNEEYYPQFVTRGSTITAPTTIVGDYQVSTWTINNTTINVSTYVINTDTVFIAGTKQRVQITYSSNNISRDRYSVNTNTPGLVMSNFRLPELMTDFPGCNSARFELKFNIINATDGLSPNTYNGTSDFGMVTQFTNNRSISINVANGGFILYDYTGRDSLYDLGFTLVIKPYYKSQISGL